jgi:hypothetical protein
MKIDLLPIGLLVLMFFAISANAGEVKYERYVNVRFAYSILYPNGILMPQGEADNGDGQQFVANDGKALMLVYGSNNSADDTLKSVYHEEVGMRNKGAAKVAFTYKAFKKNWFVVSGTVGDNIFYKKVIYKAKDDQFITFEITYHKSQRGIYDPIVSEISNSIKIPQGPQVK